MKLKISDVEYRKALEVVLNKLIQDEGLWRAFLDNISIQFQDEFHRQITPDKVREWSNNAAQSFLEVLVK